jgi:hypothetical protein
LLKRWYSPVILLALSSSAALAQKKPVAVQNDRIVLEQILQQTYQPSLIGKQMMGIGGETDIRRAGTIVVIQRPGLFGSLMHSEPASSAITGLHAELFRGHKDYEVPAGERYYVTALAVSSSTVLVGLISARSIPTQAGAGRMWTTLSFNFPDQVLATADKEAVFRAIDPWFLPEGRMATVPPPMTMAPVAAAPQGAAPAAKPAASAPVAAPPAATAPVQTPLTPGMTREQILETLGAPGRELQFGPKLWMIYPGFVAVVSDGKLESVQTSGEGSARVVVQSDPAGAEIYLDDQFVGSTPSTLLVSPGKHAVRLHASGRADWTRQVNVLSGSELTLSGTLDKN